jgi:hypothetical protein
MQNQIDKLDSRLNRHSKRLTTIERVLWVCVGLGINNINFVSLIEFLK